jgi:hypothetical protein
MYVSCYFLSLNSALQGFSPNHKITSFAEAKVSNFLISLEMNFLIKNFLIKVLDLPYERMPPRKDAPATPEDASSGQADGNAGGNGETPKANNSNG